MKKKTKKTLFYQKVVTTTFFTSLLFYTTKIISLYDNIFSLIPIMIGWYTSDLYLGIVHIYLDNKKIEKITNFHEELIYSFQYSHHINPKAFINNISIYACSGELSIIIASFINMFLFYFLSQNNNYKLFITTTFFGTMIGQVAHGFAHMNYNELNIIIKILQKCKIIISNKEHNQHHIKGFLKYGILNGWSSFVLDYLFLNFIQPFMNKYPNFFIKQEC
jgi:hypothetical protein